jgi:lipopolysaccharide transport system permease protein
MYATPIVYPLSMVPEKYRLYSLLNPLTSIMESFKHIFLGSGTIEWLGLLYSAGFTAVLVIIAVITFSKVEKSFMDTV